MYHLTLRKPLAQDGLRYVEIQPSVFQSIATAFIFQIKSNRKDFKVFNILKTVFISIKLSTF